MVCYTCITSKVSINHRKEKIPKKTLNKILPNAERHLRGNSSMNYAILLSLLLIKRFSFLTFLAEARARNL